MVTNTATPDSPWSPFGQAALEAADRMLTESGHDTISLRDIAAAAGGTHPAVLKQFGSQLGFMAELAARQWYLASAALEASDSSPMGMALADIEYSTRHPHRFRLMYDPHLWDRLTDPERHSPGRERLALERMEGARDANYLVLEQAMSDAGLGNRTRLVASLLTGLAFEFVNERLFDGDIDKQLAHARDLLGMVVG